MKTILKYLLLLIGCFSIAISCEKPDNGTEEPPVDTPDPTLEIINTHISAGKNGGEFSFSYKLENPDGSELEASCQDSWINSFDYSTEGVVKFNIDPNTSGSSRITQIVLTYGEDLSGKVTVSQSAKGDEPVDVSFEFEFDIDGPYVAMTTTPTPEDVRYYSWYYSVKSMENALAQSPGVTIEMYFKALVELEMYNAIYYGAYAGYTPEQAVAELTTVGRGTQYFELNGETSFYGFACAVTDQGDIISEVAYTTFTTGAVKPSENKLEISIDQVNTDRITYSVSTTNDDQYATLIFAAEDIEGKSDAEILEMYNSMDNYITFLTRGDYQKTVLVDKDDADYYVVAFGYEYGMYTTAVNKVKVHTLPMGQNVPPTFNFNIEKVTNFRIRATVEAEPVTSLYYTDCCYADADPQELADEISEAAQWFVDNGYYANKADCLRVMGSKGTTEHDFQQLYPETEYKIYAIGIDELTGEFNTEVIFSEVITTPAKGVSEAYIEVTFDKYFDGSALAQKYPQEFGDAAGYAVVPLKVTKYGDVAQFWYDVYSDDLSDTTYPTDLDLIIDLQINGIANKEYTYAYCDYSTILTLASFCKDSEDNDSAVTRNVFRVLDSGVSPVDEFEFFE
jgi:hypothetical protein